jgi:transcription initiation factor TFIIA large subunit
MKSNCFKISRTKNKWRFILKSGVMNIGGRDYVFSKATGEADW